MKKIIPVLVCMLASFSVPAYAQNDIDVYFNGNKLMFDSQPAIVNDRTYVPVRGIFEAFGFEVEWDGETQTAYAYGNGTEVILSLNSDQMYVNGEAVQLETAPFIQNDRALVPLRAISEALDCYVDWDAFSCTVTIIGGGIVLPTAKPTAAPTAKPTSAPTAAPTVTPAPTAAPTSAPSAQPTAIPTAVPTAAPTASPVPQPTAAPTSKPTVQPTSAPSSEREMEKEVLALVNSVRAENGLNALSWAEDVANVARAHSSDMINRSFFSHTNPDGLSPFDRLRNSGISCGTAAENIAYGQRSASEVMNSWMNSSGHRANILNKNVTEIGVGAIKNKNGTIYWTQMFISR